MDFSVATIKKWYSVLLPVYTSSELSMRDMTSTGEGKA